MFYFGLAGRSGEKAIFRYGLVHAFEYEETVAKVEHSR